MIFSSIDYLIFFLIILFLMIVLKGNTIKKTVLVLGSYYFYAYWDWRFVFMMFILSFVNYIVGIKIEQNDDAERKKRWLASGVVFNLGILGFFKYFNFFIDNANSLLSTLNIRFSHLEILLPVGISFIVFEVMSYTIDIYRGSNKSAKSFWDLALLVAFFPHLIAGPILKPKHFLPQLEKEVFVKWVNVEIGVQIFLQGLVKKIIIADRVAFFVDPVFKNPANYSPETLWLAVIAYAIQIFCDFSGYSDMAIGSAKCLGYEIPQNFRLPYISQSITEFWRRWHISLSTWLKEYLYFSLGGNRQGRARQYINLFIVMFLGGLWHGASWNFAVWGVLHGCGLMVHKMYTEYIHPKIQTDIPIINISLSLFNWFITMVFVLVTWVFFRAQDFSYSMLIIKKMFFISDLSSTSSIGGAMWAYTPLLVMIPFLTAAHLIGKKLDSKEFNRYFSMKLISFNAFFALFFILLGLIYLKPTASAPFIYFQF